jgi:hypothetical protein
MPSGPHARAQAQQGRVISSARAGSLIWILLKVTLSISLRIVEVLFISPINNLGVLVSFLNV